ncbi:MAG: hypothetical protein OQK82_07805 [Candidatus Pacearchaeota archaeon]|nr:hypothetical protein [Candidatus Pacearchaeota archaeon]
MNEKKEFKQLWVFASKVCSKKILKKVKEIDDTHEQIDVLKYSIKMVFMEKVKELKEKVHGLHNAGVEMFFVSVKLNLLSLKVKYFCVGYHKEDFKMILNLIKKIEKEIDKEIKKELKNV